MTNKKIPIDFLQSEKVQRIMASSPFILDNKNPIHVNCFRVLIELSWSYFRWNTRMAGLS